MPAGRPRTPSEIRKLTGTHLERLNKREPKYRRADAVRIPKRVETEPYALELWDEIVPELVANGLLTYANQGLCADICVAHAMMMKALDDTVERGQIVEEPIVNKAGDQVGVRVKANPAVAQVAQYMAMKCRLMIEFGMTPASSMKVNASPEAEKVDESFDEFTGGSDERGDDKSGAEVN